MLAPREAALVGAYPPVERTESLGDDDMILMSVKDSRNGRRLRFGNRGDFFNDHALSFTLGASAARGQSNYPQRHDALRVDAKLRSFKCDLDPGVEQVTPFAGEGCRRTSCRTLVRQMIWATSFSHLRVLATVVPNPMGNLLRKISTRLA